MKFSKILILSILLTNETFAGSRKVSLDDSDRYTILTDYVNYIDSIDDLGPNRRRYSSFHVPSTNSIIMDNNNSRVPIVIIEEQPAIIVEILESDINLTEKNIASYIHNNDSFRRDHLNSYSKNNHHIILVDKYENAQNPVHELLEITQDLQIKELKKVNLYESKAIKNLKEEIIYNSILYELPSRTIAVSPVISSLTNQISLRQNNLKNSGIFADSDKASDYGLWITGASTAGRHIKTKQVDEFKFHSGLATIGFDLLLDERTITGIAYSLSETKNKFISSSSKENIKIQTLTIYTGSEINEISMFYSLSSGLINVKNTRDLFYYNELITSKHNGVIVDFSTSYHKQYNRDDEFIIPKITLNYNYVYLKGFKENGVEISKTIEQKGVLIPSIIIGKNFSNVTPSLHYDLIFHPFYRQKRAKVTLLHNNQQLSSVNTSYKPEAHKIGASVELKSNAAILSINYDYLVEKKSYSHNVGLTFRYQFYYNN